jgi:hypothetical protein
MGRRPIVCGDCLTLIGYCENGDTVVPLVKCPACEPVQCPNGCGDLVKLKTPAWITTEFYDEYYNDKKAEVELTHSVAQESNNTDYRLLEHDQYEFFQNVGVAFLLEAVCPKCGYIAGKQLTEGQFKELLEKPEHLAPAPIRRGELKKTQP